MEESKRRHSIVRLVLELVEQSIVLVFLELKLAAMEVKRNVTSAKNGVVMLGLGGFLLLFSLLGVMATAIAALALVLPVWLSALIVTAVFLFAGGGLLLTGLSHLKHFSLLPHETVARVEQIAGKLKKHAELREQEARAKEAAYHEGIRAREAAHAEAVEAAVARAEARAASRAEAARVREAKREAARARKLRKLTHLTHAKERVQAAKERVEAEERKRHAG